MAESKHTPGPWQRSGVRQPSPEYRGHPVGPDGDPVVIVPYSDEHHAECLANANLIAAAPDMLEALREVVAAMPSMGGLGGLSAFNLCRAADLAKAAIAKAEGRHG